VLSITDTSRVGQVAFTKTTAVVGALNSRTISPSKALVARANASGHVTNAMTRTVTGTGDEFTSLATATSWAETRHVQALSNIIAVVLAARN